MCDEEEGWFEALIVAEGEEPLSFLERFVIAMWCKTPTGASSRKRVDTYIWMMLDGLFDVFITAISTTGFQLESHYAAIQAPN